MNKKSFSQITVPKTLTTLPVIDSDFRFVVQTLHRVVKKYRPAQRNAQHYQHLSWVYRSSFALSKLQQTFPHTTPNPKAPKVPKAPKNYFDAIFSSLWECDSLISKVEATVPHFYSLLASQFFMEYALLSIALLSSLYHHSLSLRDEIYSFLNSPAFLSLINQRKSSPALTSSNTPHETNFIFLHLDSTKIIQLNTSNSQIELNSIQPLHIIYKLPETESTHNVISNEMAIQFFQEILLQKVQTKKPKSKKPRSSLQGIASILGMKMK